MKGLKEKLSIDLWQKFITITTEETDDSDSIFYLAGGTSKIKDLRGIFTLKEVEDIITTQIGSFERIKSRPDKVVKHFTFEKYNIDQQWILSTLLIKSLHEIYRAEKFGSKIYESLQLILKKAMEIDINLFPCVNDIKRKMWIAGGQPLNFHEEIDRYLYLEVDTSKRVEKLKNVIDDLSFKKKEEKSLKRTNRFKSTAYTLLYKESKLRLRELEKQLEEENKISQYNIQITTIPKPIHYAIYVWLLIETKQVVEFKRVSEVECNKGSKKKLPSAEIIAYPRQHLNLKGQQFDSAFFKRYGISFYNAFRKIDNENIKSYIKSYKDNLRPLIKDNEAIINKMAKYL